LLRNNADDTQFDGKYVSLDSTSFHRLTNPAPPILNSDLYVFWLGLYFRTARKWSIAWVIPRKDGQRCREVIAGATNRSAHTSRLFLRSSVSVKRPA